jgi:hypothetical protein
MNLEMNRYHWSRWILSVGLLGVSSYWQRFNRQSRTELLLEKGYEVHGIIRRSSSFNTGRLHHLYADQHERRSDLIESSSQ